MISHTQRSYGRTSLNQCTTTKMPGIEGARALLETFYYAFNHQDMKVFARVWADHDLIQLNNPLGGILRGYQPVASLYRGIFEGPARVWVELSDIVEFETDNMVVFAGRETGEFARGSEVISLQIRTSRVVQWFGPQEGWRQTHHHGSIDDPQLLENYQRAVRGA